MRFTKPLTNPGPKTGRCYARFVPAIRRIAAAGKPFTRFDVKGTDASRQTLNILLLQMCRKGELVLIRKGSGGCIGVPAIYVIAPRSALRVPR